MPITVNMRELLPARILGLAATAVATAALALPGSAHAAALSAAQASYLGLAQGAAAQAGALWWDRRSGWYRESLHARSRRPLATLWDSVPMFEALSGIALADPSPQAAKALAGFAAGAERYWNPRLSPLGGYAPYPGGHSLNGRVYLDDNGWWGIAFLDAYRASGNRRYISDAQRAFTFLDAAGWDPNRGGIWWSTAHDHKAGESLAAGTLLAAMLYQDTGDPYYFAEAQKFILWGNQVFSTPAGFYFRREDDPTAMAYVQGAMIAAQALLCSTSGDGVYCTRAEQLAAASQTRFHSLDMGPQYDSIYLRSLLTLYRLDGDARWYRLVQQNAQRALANSRDSSGVFSRAWNGGPVTAKGLKPDLLQTDAATISVFAWLAATPPPGS